MSYRDRLQRAIELDLEALEERHNAHPVPVDDSHLCKELYCHGMAHYEGRRITDGIEQDWYVCGRCGARTAKFIRALSFA